MGLVKLFSAMTELASTIHFFGWTSAWSFDGGGKVRGIPFSYGYRPCPQVNV